MKIIINGKKLDTGSETIQVVKKNLIFYNKSSDKLTGDHVFPFNIPATNENLKILGFPNSLTANKNFTHDAVIYYDTTPLRGKLFVNVSNNKKIKCTFKEEVIYSLSKYTLKNLKLGSLTLGANLAQKAKEIATNPLDYPAIFFPVANQGYKEDTDNLDINVQEYHNYWDGQNFAFGPGLSIPTPFVRVDKILTEIANIAGYVLINKIQTANKWKLLTVYSNIDITNKDHSIPSEIKLSTLLSDKKITTFLREITGVFGAGIFLDHRHKTMTIRPIKELINSSDIFDITEFASNRYSISLLPQRPDIFIFKKPKSDKYVTNYLSPKNIVRTYQTSNEFNSAIGLTSGDYYVADEYAWYKIDEEGNKQKIPDHNTTGMSPPAYGQLKNEFKAGLSPLVYRKPFPLSQSDAMPVPILEHSSKSKTEERLMIYRGIKTVDVPGENDQQPTIYTVTYPCAIKDPDYGISGPSLSWHTKDGLYATWWQEWHHILSRGEQVDVELIMDKANLSQLRLDRIFMIKNQKYIPLEFSFISKNGKTKVKGKLIRIT